MPRISEIAVLQQMHQPILSIESNVKITQLSQVIGESFARLSEYLDEFDETLTDIPFVAYQDYENIDENNIKVTIGFPVSRILPGKDGIKSTFLPKGKIVFCMYMGAYNEMILLYNEMTAWIKDNGYKAKGTVYEHYYTGPDFPENQMVTKVVIPIK